MGGGGGGHERQPSIEAGASGYDVGPIGAQYQTAHDLKSIFKFKITSGGTSRWAGGRGPEGGYTIR